MVMFIGYDPKLPSDTASTTLAVALQGMTHTVYLLI